MTVTFATPAQPRGEPGAALELLPLVAGFCALDDVSAVRARRFAEIVDYALAVLGSQGVKHGTQRALADILEVSSTMIHRYRTGRTDFDNLRATTIRQMALAARLDPGTIFHWVDYGREEALQHERRLRKRPIAYTPLDLSKELVAMLTAEQEAPLATPRFDLLRGALDRKRDLAPGLFDQLVRALDGAKAIDRVQAAESLERSDALMISTLLDISVEELAEAFGIRPLQSASESSAPGSARIAGSFA